MSESKEIHDQLLNLQDAVDRHEDAINEDAADIRKIKDDLALIAEAVSKINIAAYRGSRHPTHQQALMRLRDIVIALSETYRLS
jgi:hypothetical protein